MIDITLLSIFIPTFLFVSATPGMCMTLAMTLGMSIGVRRTLWMMWGELLGVATVAILSILGVAKIMLDYPEIFYLFKYVGGAYLCYLGIQLWLTKHTFSIHSSDSNQPHLTKQKLAIQGFVSAIANPKGWAFIISLLPPFINTDLPLAPQLSILVSIILISEFGFMMLYATGGKTLGRILQQGDKLAWLNRISGALMCGVGLWLALG
ncbi:MAG: homoserine/homoserine lactone efflux protein [Polaribacter sp.]|jgi:homoserine/homoserine lactone efflux protein